MYVWELSSQPNDTSRQTKTTTTTNKLYTYIPLHMRTYIPTLRLYQKYVPQMKMVSSGYPLLPLVGQVVMEVELSTKTNLYQVSKEERRGMMMTAVVCIEIMHVLGCMYCIVVTCIYAYRCMSTHLQTYTLKLYNLYIKII